MDGREIFARLNKVFQEVFDDPSIRLTPQTTADDIEDWDSLEHITLISAVEREFHMKFKMKEIFPYERRYCLYILARPPSLVSLYLLNRSRPVSYMVFTTTSKEIFRV